jgi:hypothetical protein
VNSLGPTAGSARLYKFVLEMFQHLIYPSGYGRKADARSLPPDRSDLAHGSCRFGHLTANRFIQRVTKVHMVEWGVMMPRTIGADHSVTKRKPGPFFSRLSDRDFTDAVRIAGDKLKTQRAVFEEWAAEEGVDPRRPCDEWPGTVRAAYLNLGFAEEVFGLVMDASAARSKQKAPNPLRSGARAVTRARQGPDRAGEALPDGSPALRTLVARLAQSPLRGRATGYSDAILQRAKVARP